MARKKSKKKMKKTGKKAKKRTIKKSKAKKTTPKKMENEKTWAMISYLLSILGVAIIYLTGKWKNNFVKYHSKQSLGLFVAYVVATVVGSIVPFLGWFIIVPLAQLGFVIFWILGILNSLEGKTKPLPLIGKYSEGIDL